MAKAKKASARENKQIIRDRTILEWVLLAVLLLLAFLFLAQTYKWWPYDSASNHLGTAFSSTANALKGVDTSMLTGSRNNSGSNGNSGQSGSNGTNGTNGTTPTTPTTPGAGSESLFNFAANVNTGMTKEQLTVTGNGLNQNCTVVVNNTSSGKQEVCVYTEDDTAATVTLMNDEVVGASLADL